jgi:histone H3/H4
VAKPHANSLPLLLHANRLRLLVASRSPIGIDLASWHSERLGTAYPAPTYNVILKELYRCVCRRYQKSTDLLIRKLPFQRLVREVSCVPSLLLTRHRVPSKTCVGRLPKISRMTCGFNLRPSWHSKRQPKHTWYCTAYTRVHVYWFMESQKNKFRPCVCHVCRVCRCHCSRTRTCAPFMPVECTLLVCFLHEASWGFHSPSMCLFLVRSTIMPKDIQLYVTYLMHHSHALTRACPAQSPANSRRALLTS